MTVVQSLLSLVNIVLPLALLIGGILAFRKGYSREAGVIQERVIAALKEEVGTLRDKVDDLEKERATQDRVIATIRYALKQHGLRVIISGDFVTLKERDGQSHTTRIQQPAPPAHLSVADEDDVS
jgi:hypothetical protein